MSNPVKSKVVPIRVAIGIVVGLIALITTVEWRALYALDHPPLHRVDCVKCHSDVKTLNAMASKAGDDLYLVKRGDLRSLPPGCTGATTQDTSGKKSIENPTTKTDSASTYSSEAHDWK